MNYLTCLLLLAAETSLTFSDALLTSWWSSCDRLSNYESLRSVTAQSKIQCTGTASHDSAVQLVAFNSSSRQCTHYRCLSSFRKCRDVNSGAEIVWLNRNTISSDCWTTVQHRVSGSVDFYRGWTQYQSEFGEGPDGNYWIGLNTLHDLTASGPRKLRILMKAWNDSEHWAEYSSFSVGPESDNYRLSVSGFSGSAGIGDSLARSNDFQFTTKDADHDVHSDNCGSRYFGAWWFADCHNTHPNGQYRDFSSAIGGPRAQGVIWKSPFGPYYSLKEIEMLIL